MTGSPKITLPHAECVKAIELYTAMGIGSDQANIDQYFANPSSACSVDCAVQILLHESDITSFSKSYAFLSDALSTRGSVPLGNAESRRRTGSSLETGLQNESVLRRWACLRLLNYLSARDYFEAIRREADRDENDGVFWFYFISELSSDTIGYQDLIRSGLLHPSKWRRWATIQAVVESSDLRRRWLNEGKVLAGLVNDEFDFVRSQVSELLEDNDRSVEKVEASSLGLDFRNFAINVEGRLNSLTASVVPEDLLEQELLPSRYLRAIRVARRNGDYNPVAPPTSRIPTSLYGRKVVVIKPVSSHGTTYSPGIVGLTGTIVRVVGSDTEALIYFDTELSDVGLGREVVDANTLWLAVESIKVIA